MEGLQWYGALNVMKNTCHEITVHKEALFFLQPLWYVAVHHRLLEAKSVENQPLKALKFLWRNTGVLAEFESAL
jgi:hypothetical protein